MVRSRNACFTINNWNETAIKRLIKFASGERCDYLVFGKEIGEQGTPHLQGYTEFPNPMSWDAFNKTLGFKKGGIWARCATRQGTAREAAGYCKKGTCEDKPEESWSVFYENPHETWNGEQFGECSNQGRRTDFEAVMNEIRSGKKRTRDVLLENPMFYHQYGRTMNTLEDETQEDKWRTEMTEGFWYYGPTGTGKSHALFAGDFPYDPNTCYVYPWDGCWWDGYRGQETVLINEFRPDRSQHMRFETLLELADRWPFKVPRRGRPPTPFLAKRILISTSRSIVDTFPEKELEGGDSLCQLLRRFTQKCTEVV